MQPLPSKPVGPWGSPEADLRSARSYSDIWSSSSRSVSGIMPTASPKPAYIAQGPAEQLTSSELDRPTAVLAPALDLVNSLLDHALFTLLNTSRSTTLPALKQAVPKLLKPRLGQAAIRAAEEDLQDMADAGEELDAAAESELPAHPRSFDPELAWKLARLRAMAHVRLGDMEEEDCDDYLEQDGLDEYVNHPVLAAGPMSTLFLTSVIEFLGEQALCLAAQYAEKRHAAAIARKATANSPAPDDRGPVVIGAADMHALGREGSLCRLWRAWRRDVRMAESWASRATTPAPAPLASPTLTESARSRKGSIIRPDQSIPEEASQQAALPPIQLPLPVRASGASELQEPGPTIASVGARLRRARSQPRSAGPAAASHADLSPFAPVSPILPSADPQFQEQSRSPPRRHSVVRSLSLPASAKTRSAALPVNPEPIGPETVRTDTVGPEPGSPSPLQGSHREEPTTPETVRTETVGPAAIGPELDSPSPLREKHSEEPTSSSLPENPTEEPTTSAPQETPAEAPANFDLPENRIEEATSSAPPTTEQPSPGGQQPETDTGHAEGTDEQDSHRAGIISGAVGAIAGALGIEAMRSAQQSRQHKDSSSTIETQVHKSVAEEIMGPSNPVAAPADANTGPSINNVRDFDDMHIPVVANDDEFDQDSPLERQVSDLTANDDHRIDQHAHHEHHEPQVSEITADNDHSDHHPRHERPVSDLSTNNDHIDQHLRHARQVSDPEDLALSSDDEHPSAPPPPQKLGNEALDGAADQDPDPVDLQTAQPQRSLPTSPTSPTSINREAAIIDDHMVTVNRDQAVDIGTPTATNLQSQTINQSSAKSPRESASQYSRSDRNSASVYSSQRPVSDERQDPIAPVMLTQQATSADKSHPGPTSSISRSSRYSQQSQGSRTSSKRLTPQREQDSPLNQQRAEPSSAATEGHFAAGVAGVAATTAAAAAALAARRQHLGLRSDVENDTRQPKVEETKKSLEILINSDETLHYTLTPESARPQDGNSQSPAKIKTQTQELADFFRTTAPPGDGPVPFATAKANSPSPRPAKSRIPDKLLTPVEKRASQRAAAQASFKPRNPLVVPRDARPERNTTRDLADYARSTGPTTDAQLPQPLGTTAGAGRYTSGAGGLGSNGALVAPPNGRSSSSLPSSNTIKSTNRLHFQARDPRTTRGAGTAELIDFIREGPQQKPTDHRSDRHLTPFRSTMDSEDFDNVRASVGSARNSSVLTGRSAQGSTNSRTGLLDSQKSSNRANGANSTSAGIAQQTIPEVDRMPPKKRRGPRDPYAIDDSDDEALEEELAKAPPKQESLIDFLRNTAPPPGMSTLPVLTAMPDIDNKPDAKSSASPSKLKDLVGRSSSRAGRSTKVSNGARESSPHLTQVGSKLDKYRPTQTTHAAHVERNRQKARIEPRTASAVQTGTSDLADYLRNTGPAEPASPSDSYGRYHSSITKDQAGFTKFFKWRGTVKQ